MTPTASLLLFTLAAIAIAPGRALSMSASSSSDLAVVGVGVLGTSLCKQILSSDDAYFRSRVVTGITKSTSRHDSIRTDLFGDDTGTEDYDAASRFVAATMDDVLTAVAISETDEAPKKFKDVVFCAPPSGFDDYPSAVRSAALSLWAGPSSGGSFVFTSSGGVYEGLDGETVTETSPTCDPVAHPRSGRMVLAEREAIEAGGCALRLAGLYTLDRGAHNYWLERCGESGIGGREDGIVNLLHYDDAASACVAALRAGREVNRGKTFLISDGRPTTRRGICESALKAKKYSGFVSGGVPKFNGPEDGPRGKIYDGSKSDEALGWKPKYESFDAFMASQA